MKMPSFVRQWAKDNRLHADEVLDEITAGYPEWETVSEELVGADKYNNVEETILKHVPTGRFVRVYTHSLPYGIDDYGMEPEDDDIEEVFPVQMTITKYLTAKERKAAKGGKPS